MKNLNKSLLAALVAISGPLLAGCEGGACKLKQAKKEEKAEKVVRYIPKVKIVLAKRVVHQPVVLRKRPMVRVVQARPVVRKMMIATVKKAQNKAIPQVKKQVVTPVKAIVIARAVTRTTQAPNPLAKFMQKKYGAECKVVQAKTVQVKVAPAKVVKAKVVKGGCAGGSCKLR